MLRVLIASVLVIVGFVWLYQKLYSNPSPTTSNEDHPQVEKVRRDINEALERETKRIEDHYQEKP
ncbi:MAG: hypothetical protein AB4426_00350 [Xenococcaceae cyanobacterium]